MRLRRRASVLMVGVGCLHAAAMDLLDRPLPNALQLHSEFNGKVDPVTGAVRCTSGRFAYGGSCIKCAPGSFAAKVAISPPVL
jgi:hypothetical protein